MIMTVFVFFFNDTATTEIYTLSLHDALPISAAGPGHVPGGGAGAGRLAGEDDPVRGDPDGEGRDRDRRHPGDGRSEEHTSELQSRQYLVCRLLLEKKKHKHTYPQHNSKVKTC